MAQTHRENQPVAKKSKGTSLTWDEYFMGVACLTANSNSKDKKTQVGACIVNTKNRIIGIGYNNVDNDGLNFIWEEESATKSYYVFNAVMSAVVGNKKSIEIENFEKCRVYTTLFPIHTCAQLISQCRMSEVVYLSHKHQDNEFYRKKYEDSTKILQNSVPEIKFRKLELQNISKKFDDINHDIEEGIPKFETLNGAAEPSVPADNNRHYYFMSLAFLSGQRSKDPVTKVGACIVDQNGVIVGTGYNTMPQGIDDEFSWEKKVKDNFVCHAELNAIMFSKSRNLSKCTMYVTMFPCNNCAKLIIKCGIKKFIYYSHKNKKHASEFEKTLDLFKKCEVVFSQYTPEMDFDSYALDPTPFLH